jgi:regulator of replication initiation timing
MTHIPAKSREFYFGMVGEAPLAQSINRRYGMNPLRMTGAKMSNVLMSNVQSCMLLRVAAGGELTVAMASLAHVAQQAGVTVGEVLRYSDEDVGELLRTEGLVGALNVVERNRVTAEIRLLRLRGNTTAETVEAAGAAGEGNQPGPPIVFGHHARELDGSVGGTGAGRGDGTCPSDAQQLSAFLSAQARFTPAQISRYESVFSENEVDLQALLMFEEGDLEEIGVAKGPRVRLLRAITAAGQMPTVCKGGDEEEAAAAAAAATADFHRQVQQQQDESRELLAAAAARELDLKQQLEASERRFHTMVERNRTLQAEMSALQQRAAAEGERRSGGDGDGDGDGDGAEQRFRTMVERNTKLLAERSALRQRLARFEDVGRVVAGAEGRRRERRRTPPGPTRAAALSQQQQQQEEGEEEQAEDWRDAPEPAVEASSAPFALFGDEEAEEEEEEEEEEEDGGAVAGEESDSELEHPMSVFVSNISWDTTADALEEYFSQFG